MRKVNKRDRKSFVRRRPSSISTATKELRYPTDEGHRLGKGRNLPAFRKQATACGRGFDYAWNLASTRALKARRDLDTP